MLMQAKTETRQCLKITGLKTKAGVLMLAAQYQILLPQNYQSNVLRNGSDVKCRFCNTLTEQQFIFILGSTILTANGFKNFHDGVEQYLFWKICQKQKISVLTYWYEHYSEAAIEGKTLPFLWNLPRTIQASRPDVIIKAGKELLIHKQIK